MSERGIDISREFAKPWTDEIVRAADVVVSLFVLAATGLACASAVLALARPDGLSPRPRRR
jgi:protein-tyrosine-phosphatase